MSDIEILPGVVVRDPRPDAARAPYTFFLPFEAELAALEPGDGIKAIFAQTEGEARYEAERMWVLIEALEDGIATGTLENEPCDMPLLPIGSRVTIPLSHAIGTGFRKDKPRPKVPERREYWERCLVDDCVLAGRSRPVHIYREKPDMTREGDQFPDSGWRIRGSEDACAQDQAAGRTIQYVALGAVLNRDDSWLGLIDREPRCTFGWDDDGKRWFEYARD